MPVVIFIVPRRRSSALVLGATIFGRQIYQIGTNEVAARHAGIRTPAHQDRACSSPSAWSARVAGLMTASRLGSVRYDLGLGGELQMVLMAMLGGTYIFGGRGTILGTFLAAWLLVDRLHRHDRRQHACRRRSSCVLGVLLIVSIIATNFIYSRTQR